MKSRIAATALLATIVSTAAARNVIVEWGGHSVHDYQVVSQLVPPYDDLYILITANSEPDKAWKFDAWNDVEDQPGYINSISIESETTVSGIHLSVIGQAPHVFGAAHLDALDLKTHGDETNTIDTILITGDFGAKGPMQAFDVGTVTIGGSALSGIATNDITGPLTVGGIVGGPIQAAHITAPVTIGQLGADLTCTSMQNLTVTGPTPEGYPLPNITVNSDYTAPYQMVIGQAVDQLQILGNELSGQVHVTESLEHLKVLGLTGLLEVGTGREKMFSVV